MKTNRRSFLKQTAIASTAPFILPSSIWAAQTQPNDRPTMGFIGMGRQSHGLLRGFLQRDVQVLAVCDVDATRRENAHNIVNEHYGNNPEEGSKGCAAYNAFREIIERKDIDTVCIMTPDHWHAIQTLAALRAGKDVYCEKPLTHNIHEAITVMRAAEETGLIVQTGSQQRSSQEFRVAAELVRNGVLGRLSHVDCHFGGPAIPCDLPEEEMEPGLDWDMWLGPAPMRRYHSDLSPRGIHRHFPAWRQYREYATGMIGDWGAHHLDIAQWALGMDSSGPVEVIPADKEGASHGAKLVYENGVSVHHRGGNGIRFHGTNGEIYVNRNNFKLTVNGETISDTVTDSRSTSTAAEVQKAVRTFLQDAEIRLYESRNHVQNFIDCVESRERPIADAEIGARTAICCHLLSQSYYHHAHMKWDPKKNEFTDGTGNPAWLTREYRGEWDV